MRGEGHRALHGCSVLEFNLRLTCFPSWGEGVKLDSDYSGSAALSPIFCSNLLVRSFSSLCWRIALATVPIIRCGVTLSLALRVLDYFERNVP